MEGRGRPNYIGFRGGREQPDALMPNARGGGWNGEGGREEREEEEGKNYTRHWLIGHILGCDLLLPIGCVNMRLES